MHLALCHSPCLIRFFLLIDRHRAAIVPELTDEFIKLANEARQTEDAIVYSVKPLTDAEILPLSQVFAKKPESLH